MRPPSESPRAALAALALLVETLEASGVTSWLTDGTLLGAVRERAFIRHDLDMDTGAHISEYHPRVVPALKRAGFTVRKTHGKPKQGLQHKLLLDGFRLDIFWHYDTPEGGVQHSAYAGGERIEYHYDRLALAKLDFLGRVFWAPTPPRLHLVAKYGPDWRTPKPEWDWAHDPPNARRAT